MVNNKHTFRFLATTYLTAFSFCMIISSNIHCANGKLKYGPRNFLDNTFLSNAPVMGFLGAETPPY